MTGNHLQPKTLRELAGAPAIPAPLANSVLIIIDAQNEYVTGKLPLKGVDRAVQEISRLLTRARAANVPVIHVVHKSKAGAAAFACDSPTSAIIDSVAAKPGEIIVEKTLPSAFTCTNLQQQLETIGRKDLVIVGFMTHMCMNSTTRAAAELGYRCTVVGDACATRDLPDGQGGVVSAVQLHVASLAALADRFAIVVPRESDLQ